MTKKIKCAYHLCKKDVEESKAIERMLPLHARDFIKRRTEKILQ